MAAPFRGGVMGPLPIRSFNSKTPFNAAELVRGGLGPELVTNGGFDTDTVWTKQSDGTGTVVISGGVLTCTTASGQSGSANLVSQTGPTTVPGRTYRCTYTLSGYAQGATAINVGSGQGLNRQSNGTFSEDIVATSDNGVIRFRRTLSDFTGNIDNVSVREVIS